MRHHTTRELLAQRALAARAVRRGRPGAAGLLARIEAELERRRQARLDRGASSVPGDLCDTRSRGDGPDRRLPSRRRDP